MKLQYSRIDSAFIDVVYNSSHGAYLQFDLEPFMGCLDAPHLIPTGSCVSPEFVIATRRIGKSKTLPYIILTPVQGVYPREVNEEATS